MYKEVGMGRRRVQVVCPYCGRNARYVDSKTIYGKSYGKVYFCKRCDAYVGVHRGTDKPLGRLANKELRYWKVKAHEAFDPLWKSKRKTRSEAYAWLALQMDLCAEDCHIGMFDVEQCKKVVEICLKHRMEWST